MKKLMTVTPPLCIDCKKCMVACSFKHHQSYDPAKARIQVVSQGAERGMPVVCLQCETAACLKVCPTGALSRHDDNGVVNLDQEKCIRCQACVAACSFGNITYVGDGNVVQKCDLCGGDPLCVVFCPTGALEYPDVLEALPSKKAMGV